MRSVELCEGKSGSPTSAMALGPRFFVVSDAVLQQEALYALTCMSQIPIGGVASAHQIWGTSHVELANAGGRAVAKFHARDHRFHSRRSHSKRVGERSVGLGIVEREILGRTGGLFAEDGCDRRLKGNTLLKSSDTR